MTFLENVDKTKLQKITLIVISALVLTALALLLVIIIMSISTNATTVEIDNKVLKTGSLVLADEDHPYDHSFADSDLEVIGKYRDANLPKDENDNPLNKYYVNSQSQMKLTKEAMDATHKMLVDAEASVKQKELCIDSSYGYDDESNGTRPEYKTAQLIFLARMITSTEPNQVLGTEYREWLDANAYKYGFIKSFEDGYRYVGVAHAKLMKDKNITTLADYIEYLKKNTNADKMISVKVGNEEYSVYYVACKAGDKVRVPLGADYTVSGTNDDGVVITIKK